MALQISRVTNDENVLAAKVVAVATLGAGGVGAIPLPFADYPLLIGIETYMVKLLKDVYRIDSENSSFTSVSSLTTLNLDVVGIAGSIGWTIANALKATPAIGWISGSTIDAVIASTTVLTVGIAVSIVFSNLGGPPPPPPPGENNGRSIPSGTFIDDGGGDGGSSGRSFTEGSVGSSSSRSFTGGSGGSGSGSGSRGYEGGSDDKSNDNDKASWSMSEKIFSELVNSAEVRQSMSRIQSKTEPVDLTSQNVEVFRLIRDTAKSIQMGDTVKLLKSGVTNQERIATSISLEMKEIQNSLEDNQRTAFEMVRSQVLTDSMTGKVREGY